MLELNKIYNMDCLEGMKLIEDNTVDCIFTDVPYVCSNGGCSTSSKFGSKNKWSNNPVKLALLKNGKIFEENNISPMEYLPELYRVLRDRGHIYLMCNSLHLSNIEIAMREVGFNINNILVMVKNTCVTNQWYMKNIEFTIFARKGMAKPLNDCGIKSAINVTMPSDDKKIHDTQKPLEYVQKLIMNSTNEQDIVFDPFMGSGTTAIACKNSNRNFIGFEKDIEFHRLSQEWIDWQDKQLTLF